LNNSHFRKRPTGPILPALAARRQGRIARLAITLLGRDAAIAFLNSAHAELGGRPIDLAVASEEGLRSAEAVLTRSQP